MNEVVGKEEKDKFGRRINQHTIVNSKKERDN